MISNNKDFEVPENLKFGGTGNGNVKLLVSPKSPCDVFTEMKSLDLKKDAYIDGGQMIQWFLRHNAIDELQITTVPVLLGSGIPLFPDGHSENDIRFEHEKTTIYQSGLVQTKYLKKT